MMTYYDLSCNYSLEPRVVDRVNPQARKGSIQLEGYVDASPNGSFISKELRSRTSPQPVPELHMYGKFREEFTQVELYICSPEKSWVDVRAHGIIGADFAYKFNVMALPKKIDGYDVNFFDGIVLGLEAMDLPFEKHGVGSIELNRQPSFIESLVEFYQSGREMIKMIKEHRAKSKS